LSAIRLTSFAVERCFPFLQLRRQKRKFIRPINPASFSPVCVRIDKWI
jgi:hypothetical protein